MDTTTWIDNHPNATQLERVQALAHSLIGTALEATGFALDWYGLPEDWSITDEPLKTCLAFDDVVMRCESCDWRCAAEELEYGLCSECQQHSEYNAWLLA